MEPSFRMRDEGREDMKEQQTEVSQGKQKMPFRGWNSFRWNFPVSKSYARATNKKSLWPKLKLGPWLIHLSATSLCSPLTVKFYISRPFGAGTFYVAKYLTWFKYTGSVCRSLKSHLRCSRNAHSLTKLTGMYWLMARYFCVLEACTAVGWFCHNRLVSSSTVEKII